MNFPELRCAKCTVCDGAILPKNIYNPDSSVSFFANQTDATACLLYRGRCAKGTWSVLLASSENAESCVSKSFLNVPTALLPFPRSDPSS